jgi:hypothetical protein
MNGTAAPGWYKVTLSVSHEGFRPVQHVFMHDRSHHRAIVILVRERPTQSGSEPQNNQMQRTAPGESERRR